MCVTAHPPPPLPSTEERMTVNIHVLCFLTETIGWTEQKEKKEIFCVVDRRCGHFLIFAFFH